MILFSPVRISALSKTVFLLTAIFFFTEKANAQHDHTTESKPNVTLHVNPELGMCDFDIASNLSQAEWARATKEIGNILYLDPLAASAPLGKGHWALHLEYNSAKVDQESGAWNNTFHHPDSAHYLTGENGRISVPALRFRFGITEKWEAGIFYTSAKPFGANYGFLGLETKYAFMNDTSRGWAAAVRASYVTDANIRDFNIFSAATDLTASKTVFRYFTPYAGVGLNWSHGHIVSNEVSLKNENAFAVHGIAGIDFRWRFVNVGCGVMIGDGMGNRSFKVGVAF